MGRTVREAQDHFTPFTGCEELVLSHAPSPQMPHHHSHPTTSTQGTVSPEGPMGRGASGSLVNLNSGFIQGSFCHLGACFSFQPTLFFKTVAWLCVWRCYVVVKSCGCLVLCTFLLQRSPVALQAVCDPGWIEENNHIDIFQKYYSWSMCVYLQR